MWERSSPSDCSTRRERHEDFICAAHTGSAMVRQAVLLFSVAFAVTAGAFAWRAKESSPVAPVVETVVLAKRTVVEPSPVAPLPAPPQQEVVATPAEEAQNEIPPVVDEPVSDERVASLVEADEAIGEAMEELATDPDPEVQEQAAEFYEAFRR